MKRTTLLTTMLVMLGICIASQLVMAQPQRMSVDERIEELDKVVDLTEEQEKSIREILEQPREERRSRSDRSEGRERGGRAPMMGRGFAPFMDVLTEEQQEKYREYQSERMIEMRIGFMERELELSDKQKEQLAEIFREEAKKGQELRSAEATSRSARREAMNKFREIQQESQEKIGKILTDEQNKQYEEMMERMRSRRRPRD